MKSLFVGCVLKMYFHKHIPQRKPLLGIKQTCRSVSSKKAQKTQKLFLLNTDGTDSTDS